jgi:TonB-linked SusC/RagA family outer membrane protein
MSIFRLYSIVFLTTLLFSDSVFGQDQGYVLRGRILGNLNQPVSGVSVSYEGSSASPEISDSLGQFKMDVPSGNLYLIINPVEGYHRKRVFLSNRRELLVYLTPRDMDSPDELVSIIAGAKERRNIISSHATMNPEQKFIFPYQTIDEYFQGTVSGMQVTNHSGMPGSGTTAVIRQVKSLFTTTQPLYVVDGIPLESFGIFGSELSGYVYNPLTSLEPFDIANITVLKDNYATSLYGMRGSNGVIMIETLKPTELRTTIDVSMKSGITLGPDRLLSQLNNVQHRSLANEVLLTSDMLEESFPDRYPALFSDVGKDNYHRYKHNTNWQEEIFRQALINDVQLRIKGGDGIARYGLSIGYLNHEGIIKTTSYDRLNIRLVGTFNIFRWLRMYISTNLNTNTSNLVESALAVESSPIMTGLAKTPMMMPYLHDRDGRELTILDDVGSLNVSNPFAIFNNFRGLSNNSHSLNSIRLEGDISKQLKLNSVFGINLNTLSEDVFLPNYGMALYENGTAYNISKSVKNFLYTLYNDNSLSYIPELGIDHKLKFDLGMRTNINRLQMDVGISRNSLENDEYQSLQHGVSHLNEIYGENGHWNRLAAYTNASYAFRSKYLLNLALTAEHSTRLGDNSDLMHIGGNPYSLFYSIGAGWRVSSEDFLKNLSALDELKLRVSYSVSGNDDIGNLSARNYLRVDHYRETTGMVPGNLTDGTLTNEFYSQISAGLDLGLIGNRIKLIMDYYSTTTSDLLILQPQPYYTGFDYLPKNDGVINTHGIELGFGWRVIDFRKFKWDLSLNITPWQKSVVKEMLNDYLVTSFEGGEFITQTGSSLLEFYGYHFDGVFSTFAEADEANLVNEKGIPFIAGDAIFRDISGPDGVPDSIINDFDKAPLGSPFPEMYGGLGTRIQYGRWSLDANVYFSKGNKVFNYLRYKNERMTGLANQSTNTLNRWYYDGQVTDVPRALWNDPIGNSSFSTRWIEDGSFIRLQNITLSYTIPQQVLFFRNLKIYVTGSNLFTMTDYLGYSPEFSFSFHQLQQGIDYGLMPASRSFIFGVKMGL